MFDNMPGTVAPDSTTSPHAAVPPQLTRLPPALSARVHALLNRQPGQGLMPDEAAKV
jgi:hypothetical protein